MLRLALIATIGAIGGVIGLFLGETTLLRAGLAGLGLVAIVILVGIALRQDQHIRALMRERIYEQLRVVYVWVCDQRRCRAAGVFLESN